jgi:ELWxxDGT repeat protein
MTTTRSALLTLTLTLTFAPAFGAQLVKDVNAAPQNTYSGGASFERSVTVAQGTLFRLDDGIHGEELWITNGTPGGTRLVKDIQPGPLPSNINNLTLVNGVMFFRADDGANGFELWRSDGTTDGTRMIANIGPGAESGSDISINGTPMTVINGVVYFRGLDAVAGGELWRTDGTATGTYRLADISPGVSGSEIQDFIIIGSRLFFTAMPEQGTRELWTSDGTPAGTHRVTQIPRNVFQGLSIQPVIAGGTLFFVGDDGTHGSEVWRVGGDGASGGMIADLNTMGDSSGAGKTLGSEPGGLMAVGNDVVFGAVTMTGPNQPNAVRHEGLYRASTTGSAITLIRETPRALNPSLSLSLPGGTLFHTDGDSILWRTDGTAANTGPMTSVNVESGGFSPDTVRDNGVAYFYAKRSGASRYDLWRTDGTVAGTREYAVLDAETGSGNPAFLGGRAYFTRGKPMNQEELWTSDGTSVGTQRVMDLPVGLEIGGLASLNVSNGKLYFVGFDSDFIPEPWTSDGTEAGTQRLADITAKFWTESSEIGFLGTMGDSVFVRADDGVNGVELWASDGTTAGTRRLTSAQPADQVITPQHFVSLGSGVGLFELTDSTGTDLWRTDGTAAGTFKVFDFPGSQNSGEPFYFGTAVQNGLMYFGAFEVGGMALWRTDGTLAGTERVKLITDTYPDTLHVWRATANSRIFISTDGGSPKLYSSDGTAGGTLEVAGSISTSPLGVATLGNRVCFNQYYDLTNSEIYCTDGSAGSVAPLTNLASLGLGADYRLFVSNGLLLINANAPGGGGASGLYATDGSPNGLHKISDQTIDYEPIPANGGRLAWLVPASGGFDIWVTDGTQAGTHSALPAGADRTRVLEMVGAFGDAIIYWVNDLDRGPTLWKSNLDGSGARFVADVDPLGVDGPRNGGNFQQLGDQLLFTASRQDLGDELWTISATSPNATEESATTTFNTAIAINVLANDADFDGSLNPASVEVVTPPSSGTTTINVATGAISYAPNAGFSGSDTFTYRVADNTGKFSNAASVSVITTTAVSTSDPGTAPVTPPPSGGGGSSSGGSSSGGGKGGGGAFGLDLLGLAFACAWVARRRRCH